MSNKLISIIFLILLNYLISMNQIDPKDQFIKSKVKFKWKNNNGYKKIKYEKF